MSKIKSILFVCTGNSCRSVMASGLLQKMFEGKDDYKISDAGLAAIKGMPPTKEVLELMSEENIDVSLHLSQPLSEELAREADLILVMEKAHKENILTHFPAAWGKVHLLSEFARHANEDKLVDPNIPDPIGKPLDFYRRVFAVIKESVARTAKKLEEE